MPMPQNYVRLESIIQCCKMSVEEQTNTDRDKNGINVIELCSFIENSFFTPQADDKNPIYTGKGIYDHGI